jgi:hypothetical protein
MGIPHVGCLTLNNVDEMLVNILLASYASSASLIIQSYI